MDTKSNAEIEVLLAADNWAREVMRQEKYLNITEQKLLDTVLNLQRITRGFINIPPPKIPKPPHMPQNLYDNIVNRMKAEDLSTIRYSKYTTIPTPNPNKKNK